MSEANMEIFHGNPKGLTLTGRDTKVPLPLDADSPEIKKPRGILTNTLGRSFRTKKNYTTLSGGFPCSSSSSLPLVFKNS